MTKKPTTIVFVVVAGIVVVYSGAMLCLYLVGLKSFRVPGGSMEPTISVGEHVLVNTRFYRKHGDLKLGM